jgi:hypothetical protein
VTRALVIVVLVAGCDIAFRIDGLPTAPDALPASCRVVELGTSADTFLADASPHGGEDALIASATQPVLIKFYLDHNFMVGEHVAALWVHLYALAKADACGPNCAACPPTQAKHDRVYWSTTNWNPDEATRDLYRAGQMWDAALAEGIGDRSDLVVDDVLPATAGVVDLRVPMVAVEQVLADPWLTYDAMTDLGRLAIQLHTDDTVVFASSEHDAGTCRDGRPGPTASLTLCQ